MPDPRLLAVITALLMIAGAPARADYDIAQLQQIEQYILQKDCAALWQYLTANPSIMSGGDALARELRTFVAATERGQLNCFAARTAQTAVVPPTSVVNFAAANAVTY
ncbi:hypothetical protein [Defluviimonas sp. SAOS-178_SWC]|uniref:hypothetical protein n=1 Tax=Defluviimonas sp. SAOS-178_SWC TaxID=3121287 RepID=UPI003221B4B9